MLPSGEVIEGPVLDAAVECLERANKITPFSTPALESLDHVLQFNLLAIAASPAAMAKVPTNFLNVIEHDGIVSTESESFQRHELLTFRTVGWIFAGRRAPF